MAHFAQLNEENIVTQVIVVANQDTYNEDGVEVESIGTDFCKKLLGGRWIQTSYNGNIRKNYAGIGMTYDEGRDAFIHPKPYPSWVLNETTCRWESPIPMPTNTDENQYYSWNELTTSWVLETSST